MIHLQGPRAPRTNSQARARIPMNAAQVRAVIDEMELRTKSKAARIGLAESAIRIGRVTECGRAVWREYLDALNA